MMIFFFFFMVGGVRKGSIVVKVNSGRLKGRVWEILSVVLPQNSIEKTTFNAYLKSGVTLKVNQQIQLFRA